VALTGNPAWHLTQLFSGRDFLRSAAKALLGDTLL
jgi:hypothetical protein